MTQPCILNLSCLDRPGVVHAVSGFLLEHGANIEEAAQFHDRDTGLFFMRVQFSGARTSVPELRGALETFANPRPERDFEINMECPEFTCVCPKTGQPDFATIRITYVPDQICLELKSLKLYLWSYRNEGAFHEAVTNQILDDLVAACQPRKMTVVGDFNVRGGIHTTVTASYSQN